MNYFSHDEIEQMKLGEQVSKTFTDKGDGAPVVKTVGPNFINQVSTGNSEWATSPPPKITGNKKVTRPTIEGSGSFVTKPNVERHLAAYNERQEAQKKVDEQIEKERAEIREFVDAKQLMATIHALTRKVNRLEKQVKANAKEDKSQEES